MLPVSMARIMASVFLSPDADQPQNDGAENNVDAKLGKEVDADETDDHKPAHVIAEAEVLRHISEHRQEEDPAAEQKYAGVHDRADDGRGDGGKRAVFLSEPRIHEPRQTAAGNALYEHREQRSRHAEGEKRRGVAREQHHHAENKAEPQPRRAAVYRRAHHDGQRDERHRDRAEPDEAAKQLQNDDQRREKRQTRQTPGLFLRVCVHIQFLLLLLP